MKIAITGGKGGTGKSMVATSLAVQLAQNHKIMLVDADTECPNDYLLLNVKNKKVFQVHQLIPRWNFNKCTKCGQCALACKQDAIVFVKDKFPAFVKDACIGCRACVIVCPEKAISEGKKIIGTIYQGRKYNLDLITGELKLGELASGEIVVAVRKYADKINKKLKNEIILIDSAAGIGCPVIASLTGTDYIIAVTEPTPSAFHDLKRVIYLANHFKITHGLIINKSDLEKNFCKKIEEFARKNAIPILGKLPYDQDFVNSAISMRPLIEIDPKYNSIFDKIIMNLSQIIKQKL